MVMVNGVPTLQGNQRETKVRQYPGDETACNKGLKFNDERISEDHSSDLDNILEEACNSVADENFNKPENQVYLKHLHKDGQDLEKLTEIRDELIDNLQNIKNYCQDVTDEVDHVVHSEQNIVHALE